MSRPGHDVTSNKDLGLAKKKKKKGCNNFFCGLPIPLAERYFRPLPVESHRGAYEKSSSSHVALANIDAAANRTSSAAKDNANRRKNRLSGRIPCLIRTSRPVSQGTVQYGTCCSSSNEVPPGYLYVPEWMLIYCYEELEWTPCGVCVMEMSASFLFVGEFAQAMSALDRNRGRSILFRKLQAQPAHLRGGEPASERRYRSSPLTPTEEAKGNGKGKVLEERKKNLLARFHSWLPGVACPRTMSQWNLRQRGQSGG